MFILAIITTSLLSRILRATELRVTAIRLDPLARRFIEEAAASGEIDIIAKQGAITIFIEVKTLTSSKNFFPEQNVNARKRGHMLACAEHFAVENAIDHWQIDVIAIEGKQGLKPKITHFENAI